MQLRSPPARSTRSSRSLRSQGHDLLVAPTLSVAPPAADAVEVDVRGGADPVHVSVQRPGLARPRASRASSPSDPGVGRPGDDALVLAAGLALERRFAAGGGVKPVPKGDLEFAHHLADAADAITLARFGALDLHVETKPDLTPVSEADRAAEEAVRALVAASGRGEGVLGEELGDDGGDVRWIVDPIDGTKNYVRGVPVWATLLALQRRDEVVVGLVSAPALGRRWWAARGEGAFANGERCRVSAVARLEDGAVSTTSARGMPAGWRRVVERAWSNRGLGDFWQHCLVAEGALDVACDPMLKLWDFAAVQLIVEEAGGRCTTFDGEPPASRRELRLDERRCSTTRWSHCSASERRLSNV